MSIWGSPVLPGGGGAADCWWRVRFYNVAGTTLKHTEYVQNGGDCIYGTDMDWAAEPGGEAVSGITEDVSRNLDLYRADNYLVDMTPLVEVRQTSYSAGPTTYTASRALRVLAVNSNSHTNTDSTACTAGISTTGTVLSTDTRTSSGASGSTITAGQLTLSIIQLAAGDTVTFTNNSVSSTKQFHLLFATGASTLANTYFECWPDKKSGNTRTVSLNSANRYLALVFQISNNTRSQQLSAAVSPTDNAYTYNDTYYHASAVGEVEASGSVTIATANEENFIGSLMAVYELAA